MPRDPWKNPDPAPGDFDAELESIDPRYVDRGDGDPKGSLTTLGSVAGTDARRLGGDERALTCFVVGPIGNRHEPPGSGEREVYEEALRVMAEVIEPACQAASLSPVRADALARAGELNEQIFRRLRDDDVVIADLTGANPNVMYELGLRHTKNKLTVQIGEYGQLPFDVASIRTIQFSRSAIGLINARDELKEVLEAGVAGEYDAVTATRIWNDSDPTTPLAADNEAANVATPSDQASHPAEDEKPFLDVMAKAEDRQHELEPALEAVTRDLRELTELAENSAGEIERSDTAGHGMKGRLQVATRYARGLEQIASKLESDVDRYTDVLGAFFGGHSALIGRLEEDPEALEDQDASEFAALTRQLADVTRESMASLAGVVDVVEENAKLSRVLRGPSKRLTAALSRFTEATGAIDDLDRRLESLGVAKRPPNWEPDLSAEKPEGDLLDPGEGSSQPG